MKKIILSFVAILSFIFVLVSCSSSPSLEGTWEIRGTADGVVSRRQLIFLENGTGEATNLDTGVSNTFIWASGAQIPIEHHRFGLQFHDYEIDGDVLYLSRDGTVVARYRRVD